MADLGTAVLRIEVEQEGFKQSLEAAKKTIQQELGGTIQTATQRGARGNQGGNRGRDAELRAASQLLRLRNSINILEANGVNVSRLRSRLSDLETLAADKKYKALKQEGEALRQVVSEEQNRLRVSNILARNAQKEVQLNKQSDEAFRKAVAKTQRETRFAESYGPQLPKPARATGGGTQSAEAAERRLAKQRERAAKATERAAQREAKRVENERKAASQRRRDIISNIAIGAGFPLLFGQGAGAAAGGALGGGLGGALGGTAGFAGSIIGTALGQAFDTALQKAQVLAKGLEDPITNFDALKEASLISSAALEKQIASLIASGKSYEALVLLQNDLSNTFGDLSSAEEYQKAIDELNRSWAIASTRLAAFVAGPLANFLNALNRQSTENILAEQIRQRVQQLTPQQREEVQQFAFQRPYRTLTEQIFEEISTLFGGSYEADRTVKTQKEIIDFIRQRFGLSQQELAGQKRLNEARRVSLQIAYKQGQALTASAAGIEAVVKAAELAQVRKGFREFGLPEDFSSLDREDQTRLTKGLNAEQLQKVDELRKKEFTTLNQLVRLDIERGNQLRNNERGLRNTLSLIAAQNPLYRENLSLVQDVTSSIIEARQARDLRIRDINLVRSVTSQGDIQNQRRLAQELRLAGLAFADSLAKGSLKLSEASQKLADNVREAVLNLSKIRGAEEGLNKYLSPELRGQRAEQTNRRLQPLFFEALGRLRQLIPNVDLSDFALSAPTTGGLNEKIIDFVETVNREFKANQDLRGAEDSLRVVNENLIAINSDLVAATQRLAVKEWKVNLNVVNQAGGASTVQYINGLSQ